MYALYVRSSIVYPDTLNVKLLSASYSHAGNLGRRWRGTLQGLDERRRVGGRLRGGPRMLLLRGRRLGWPQSAQDARLRVQVPELLLDGVPAADRHAGRLHDLDL